MTIGYILGHLKDFWLSVYFKLNSICVGISTVIKWAFILKDSGWGEIQLPGRDRFYALTSLCERVGV